MTHIDDFIDDYLRNDEPGIAYARAFFAYHRLDAVAKLQIEPLVLGKKLFCKYGGHIYRVTGASAMGDIWLRSDYNNDHGYDERVDVMACTNFSPSLDNY